MSLLTTLENAIAQSPMHEFLPKNILGWKTSEATKLYSDKEIYDYMNGAGEIYRAYNFKDLLVQRYINKQQQEILVEIFDMQSSEDAFGVFTHTHGRGKKANIGQGSEYQRGLLCFWKERYFICIRAENETPDAKKTVLELGKYISKAIKVKGNKPALLQFLSENEYVDSNLRYFHKYEILNIHFYIADENILYLDENSNGLIVPHKEDKSRLLLLQYPSEEKSTIAYQNFLKHYMPDATTEGIIQTENRKYTISEKVKNYIFIIFDATDQKHGIAIIEKIKRRLP
ncbi:MAG: hypothetical protein QME52_01405 [Bacteroidota bacterium]|nr:hypothetical protein [Bacteroidota bacterium]